MNFLLALILVASNPDGSSVYERGNLLRGATVTRQEGAPDHARMADGIAPTDGDVWDGPNTAVLKAGGIVEWDLGAVTPIAAARIQADNNDRYIVSTSIDGASWNVLWVGKPVELPGVQTRTSEELTGQQARFVRLTAEGGDSMYSIGELELFDSTAALVGAQLKRIEPPKPPPPPEPPPCNSGLGVVIGVAAFGAYLLWKARERNLAEAKANEPAKASEEKKDEEKK